MSTDEFDLRIKQKQPRTYIPVRAEKIERGKSYASIMVNDQKTMLENLRFMRLQMEKEERQLNILKNSMYDRGSQSRRVLNGKLEDDRSMDECCNTNCMSLKPIPPNSSAMSRIHKIEYGKLHGNVLVNDQIAMLENLRRLRRQISRDDRQVDFFMGRKSVERFHKRNDSKPIESEDRNSVKPNIKSYPIKAIERKLTKSRDNDIKCNPIKFQERNSPKSTNLSKLEIDNLLHSSDFSINWIRKLEGDYDRKYKSTSDLSSTNDARAFNRGNFDLSMYGNDFESEMDGGVWRPTVDISTGHEMSVYNGYTLPESGSVWRHSVYTPDGIANELFCKRSYEECDGRQTAGVSDYGRRLLSVADAFCDSSSGKW